MGAIRLPYLVITGCLVACSAQPEEARPSVARTRSALATSPASASFAADGTVTFEVTLPSGQRYVELFARKNGIQDVALPIVGSAAPGEGERTTYSHRASGYAPGDVVEYRFYSYLPDRPGVFTPGPAERAWSTLVVQAPRALTVPVSKDASLVGFSYAVGNGWDMRFGGYATVDVASYHHDSLALFGFDLTAVPPGSVVTGARLVLGQVRSASGSAGTATLARVSSDASWTEANVTRRTAPAHTRVGEVSLPASGRASLEVTSLVADAVSAGQPELGLLLLPGQGNFFIDAKENGSGLGAALEIETSPAP